MSLILIFVAALLSMFGNQVAKSQLINVATGQPAQQSTTGYDAPASRAVDGNTASVFSQGASCTHTVQYLQSNVRPWWFVDLRAMYTIRSLTIYNRGDCCYERLSYTSILLSNDSGFAGDWSTTNQQTCGRIDRPTTYSDQIIRINCPSPMPGRFVSIRAERPLAAMTICEVYVWAECGFNVRMSSTSDVISVVSPRYPLRYSANSNCSWTISAPASSTTHRWLRLALPTLNTQQDQHFLQIDGYRAVSGHITSPRVWYSMTATARIRFTSNGAGQGFNMTVTATDRAPVVCGGPFVIAGTETEISIQWPPSPQPSTTSAQCLWTVSARGGRSIKASLDQFTLRSSGSGETCRGADVTFQRVLPTQRNYDLCDVGTNVDNWQDNGLQFNVTFSSAVETLGTSGFQFRFTACGFSTILNNLGSPIQIRSPNHPNNYPNNARCLWRISAATPVRTLNLTVDSITLASSTDRLQVVVPSGTVSEAADIPGILATNVATAVTSTTNPPFLGEELIVIFESDSSLSAVGFTLTVRGIGPTCADRNCSHICTMTDGVPHCSCPDGQGWRLGVDQMTCQDINECAPDHATVCQGFAECYNTPGSYICNCTGGYRFSDDGRTCSVRDGGWTQWSSWSECSAACGGGQQMSFRNCTEPTIQGSGRKCLLSDNSERAMSEERSQLCNKIKCTTTSTTVATTTTEMTTQPPTTTREETVTTTTTARPLTCRDLRCSHTCSMRNRKARCTCPTSVGWTLDSDNRTCIDINECASANICGDFGVCVNTLGSFRCNCSVGYLLSSNGRRCFEDPNRSGGWSAWGKWSSCNVSCGEGYRNATRRCTKPEPQGSGQMCLNTNGTERVLEETKFTTCTLPSCPDESSWTENMPLILGAGGTGGVMVLAGAIAAVANRLKRGKNNRVGG